MSKILICLLLVNFIYSLNSSYTAGKDIHLTRSQELLEYENKLDKQILQLNVEISKYIILVKLDIRKVPEKIVYYNNPGYIELSAFSEYQYGLNIKYFRMFHENGKYIKSVFVMVNKGQYSFNYKDLVIDTNPLSLEKDKIEILSDYFNQTNKLIMSDIENSVVYPNRILLKKEFFIPSLIYYLDILKRIYEYQFREEVKKENALIYRMKKTKRF